MNVQARVTQDEVARRCLCGTPGFKNFKKKLNSNTQGYCFVSVCTDKRDENQMTNFSSNFCLLGRKISSKVQKQAITVLSVVQSGLQMLS